METGIFPFEILRSLHTRLRGSRNPFDKNADFLEDFSVNTRNEDILKLVLVCFFSGSFSGKYLY